MPDAAPPAGFSRALLEWGAGQRTDLPWRATREAWAVLVAETMLQQTPVARVAPRYAAFLARFPTASDCAAAPRAEVVRAWRGLGYNRRAVNLHRAAVVISAEHGGAVPADLPALLTLPGVGPYTARAVAALAFGADVGVLDTNAGRVLARAVAGRPLARRHAQALADRLVPAGRARAWNQAVMDLGATVCVARAPRCPACPVAGYCAWRRGGDQAADPAVGTAGASRRQAPFAGSDREGRGRLVDALRGGAIELDRVPDAAGWPDDPERSYRVADQLVGEGLAEVADGCLTLPG